MVRDSFTDTDSTFLADHIPEVDDLGNGWIVGSGGWEIQANRVRENTGINADHRATIDSGIANYDVQVRIRWEEEIAGVVFLYGNESNWFMFWFDGVNDLVIGKLVSPAFQDCSLQIGEAKISSNERRRAQVGTDKPSVDEFG